MGEERCAVHFYQKRMKRGGVGQMNSEEKAETQK
jgi:hypothetical protein